MTPKVVLYLLSAVLMLSLPQTGLTAPAEATTTPTSRDKDPGWLPRHNEKVKLAKKGNVDLVFIGDSITHGFEKKGKAVWDQYYAKRNALNLGFGGDRTEHVLWRLDHGEIEGIAPKLAIVMIGTNNTRNKSKPEQIAAGVQAICTKLRSKLPDTRILLLAIFPRGPKPTDPLRLNNEAANKLIAKISDDKQIFFLDINSQLLTETGMLTREIMGDFLHPTPKGYEIWGKAIEPTVAKLMGEPEK